MTFRDIGLAAYRHYVEYQYINSPSTTNRVKCRRKNLKTFSDRNTRKKKQNLAEKQRKLVQTCIKKTLALSLSGHQLQAGAHHFLDIPRAIADADGFPCKGVKANTTRVLERRYGNIVQSSISTIHLPKAIVLEGMFVINTSPLKSHSMKTFISYYRFLVQRWIVPYLRSLETTELHMVFDDPGRNGLSPKSIEQESRDSSRDDRDGNVIPVEDDIALPGIKLACIHWKSPTEEALGELHM